MPTSPRLLESKYARTLRKLIRKTREAFKKQLVAEWPAIASEYNRTVPVAMRRDDAITYIARLVGSIKLLVGRDWTQMELEELALSQIDDVNDLVKKSVDNQWKRVLGVNPMLRDEGLKDFLAARAREHAKLITSIPDRQVPSLESGILAAVQRGTRVEELSSFIDDRFKAMEANATTIARTETGKVYADLTEYRSRELGVEKYTWATVGDDRVRPSHAAMDGVELRWDDPPTVDGELVHPGQAINCRCVALPVIE